MPSLKKALPDWKTLALILIGGLALTFLVAFIPLPIPPLITKLILAGLMTVFNPFLGIGAWISVANEFLGMLPKPGKTEGTSESEAI